MPTEIDQAAGPANGYSRTPSVGPLAILATVAITILHLVSGVMLERSHASSAIEPPALAVLDDEATCSAEVRPPEPALPYD